jgi:hypothetical protein
VAAITPCISPASTRVTMSCRAPRRDLCILVDVHLGGGGCVGSVVCNV